MRIAIVVAAHDGLQSILTGVGVIVNSFIESFDKIKRRVPNLLKNEISLICLAPWIEKNSVDYHPEIRKLTEKICKCNNGKLIEIYTLSGRNQKEIWGDVRQWDYSSKVFAEKVKEMSKDYDQILLFAHDTIFAKMNYYLKENKGNVTSIWIPHSLGSTFKNEDTNKQRLDLEKEAISAINSSKDQYIGYIGETIKKELSTVYNAETKKLIPLINGLYERSKRYKISWRDIKRFNSYCIPKDKKIIFSWGRAVTQKGYDILIPSLKKFLERNKEYHLILLMPEQTSEEKYLVEISHQMSKLPKGSYTRIRSFDSKLPVYILRMKNLDKVIFSSRFEGNSVTLMEAIYFSDKKVKILCSNIKPFKEFSSFVDGFFNLNEESLSKILGKQSVKSKLKRRLKNLSLVENYSSTLSRLSMAS
jgi:glycosyltransferase involved in cell wall biosynthesis